MNHAQQLQERTKELNCLYRVSQAVSASSQSLDAVFQDVARAIPHGWQFSESAVARIEVSERVYSSGDAHQAWAAEAALREPLVVRGEAVGQVQVGYQLDDKALTHAAFLPEEAFLLRAIASLLTQLVERRRLESELALLAGAQQELAEHVLSGFIPICAACKSIRDEQGVWSQMELYIQKRTQATFSHTVCPPCKHVLYPSLAGD
jgi:hypothetical protein